MNKKTLIILAVVFSVFVITALVFADSSNRRMRLRHADKNKDGIVDSKEMQMEKRWEHRRQFKTDALWKKRKVNTEIEQKYDANNDGWLQPEEAKQLLQDRYTLIKTEGNAKVDTTIEEAYDTNGDGIIDAKEAEALKEDLQ